LVVEGLEAEEVEVAAAVAEEEAVVVFAVPRLVAPFPGWADSGQL
jgi:hypothetical protein